MIPIWAGEAQSNHQDWICSWHWPDRVPDGTPDGSSGICVIGTGEIILITCDGTHWDLPSGRPEGMRRGRRPCDARCVKRRVQRLCRRRSWDSADAGPQAGQALLRSLWRADVELGPWSPQFETTQRRTVLPTEVVDQVAMANGLARVVSRALHGATVIRQPVAYPLAVCAGSCAACFCPQQML
jgi:hypothetical protein